MANGFLTISKIPLLDSPALFFLREVAKIRQKIKIIGMQVSIQSTNN
jgi:hypothetical protein